MLIFIIKKKQLILFFFFHVSFSCHTCFVLKVLAPHVSSVLAPDIALMFPPSISTVFDVLMAAGWRSEVKQLERFNCTCQLQVFVTWHWGGLCGRWASDMKTSYLQSLSWCLCQLLLLLVLYRSKQTWQQLIHFSSSFLSLSLAFQADIKPGSLLQNNVCLLFFSSWFWLYLYFSGVGCEHLQIQVIFVAFLELLSSFVWT